MQGDLPAIICAILVPLALIDAVVTKRSSRRIMALSLTLLLFGKLLRIRSIIDVHVEPVLADLTGAHNLPVLLAVLSVSLGYAGVAFVLTSRRIFLRVIVPLGIAALVASSGTFVSAYGDHYREYLSQGGVSTVAKGLRGLCRYRWWPCLQRCLPRRRSMLFANPKAIGLAVW